MYNEQSFEDYGSFFQDLGTGNTVPVDANGAGFEPLSGFSNNEAVAEINVAQGSKVVPGGLGDTGGSSYDFLSPEAIKSWAGVFGAGFAALSAQQQRDLIAQKQSSIPNNIHTLPKIVAPIGITKNTPTGTNKWLVVLAVVGGIAVVGAVWYYMRKKGK